MKKLIGVIVILFTLLLTVIYRQLTGCRVKDKPGHTCKLKPDHTCKLLRLREDLPLYQLLIQ
jgi:hypothetical protein